MVPIFLHASHVAYSKGEIYLDCPLGKEKIRIFKERNKHNEIEKLPKLIEDIHTQLFIEGIQGSKTVGDVVLTLTRKSYGQVQSQEQIKLTVVPLIILYGITPTYKDKDKKDEWQYEETSLYGVAWKPDGSSALAVGDRATVVAYTPTLKYSPDGYESLPYLEMSTEWREQLDALRLHTVPNKPADENRSYLNRFNDVTWTPYGYPLIVGGAWTKYHGSGPTTWAAMWSPQGFPQLHPFFPEPKKYVNFYYGGACVLSFHENTPEPFKLVKAKNTKKEIVDYREDLKLWEAEENHDTIWDVEWRPSGNSALMVGEKPGKLFEYKECQIPSSIYLLAKYEGLGFSDFCSLAWRPASKLPSPYAFIVGDNGFGMRYNPDVSEFPIYEKLFGAGEALLTIVWHPSGDYFLAGGSKLWRGEMDAQDNPTVHFVYEDSFTITGEKTENNQKIPITIPLYNGINGSCWQPDNNYAILTGGIPADLLCLGYSVQDFGTAGTSAVLLYEPNSKKVFRVAHTLGKGSLRFALRNTQWRPGNYEDTFALTVIGYRY